MPALKAQRAHCKTCEEGQVGGTFAATAILLASLPIVYFILKRARKAVHHQLPRLYEWLKAVLYDLFVKVKIVFGFAMILSNIENVYKVELPAEVRQIVEAMKWVITFGLDWLMTPLKCVGLHGYYWRLSFYMAVPVILILLIIGGFLFAQKKHDTMRERLSMLLQPLTMVIFVACAYLPSPPSPMPHA